MSRKKPPRWYFSFRSPYSWLAYRDLITHYPDVADAIDWHPFWEPDTVSSRMLAGAGGSFPYVPMTREKHRYILQDLRRLAGERGLGFRWPVDREPNWETSHLGYLAAKRAGRGREFIAEVYRARWELGLDISSPEVIAHAATEAGLDGRRIAAAAQNSDTRADGVTALLAVHRDGVFGVPFFINGFDKYWGVDRLPGFAQAVRDAATPPVVAPLETASARVAQHAELVDAADIGHAGGCG